MKKIFIFTVCVFCLSSCYTRRLLVGDVKPKEAMVEVSKKHDAHFIAGLAKTAKSIAQEHVGDAENFAVKTSYGFGDILLSAITLGIYTPTTTKYYIPLRDIDGFDFERRKKEKKARFHKPKGFMLSFDFGGMAGYGIIRNIYSKEIKDNTYPLTAAAGASLTFGYRVGPHFYIGAGADMTPICFISKYRSYDDGMIDPLMQPYLRLRYMALDKKVTPIIGLDSGWTIALGDGSSGKTGGLFFVPHIGVERRMGLNSYFDFTLGYRCGPKIDIYGYGFESGFEHSFTVYRTGDKFQLDGIQMKFGFGFLF